MSPVKVNQLVHLGTPQRAGTLSKRGELSTIPHFSYTRVGPESQLLLLQLHLLQFNRDLYFKIHKTVLDAPLLSYVTVNVVPRPNLYQDTKRSRLFWLIGCQPSGLLVRSPLRLARHCTLVPSPMLCWVQYYSSTSACEYTMSLIGLGHPVPPLYGTTSRSTYSTIMIEFITALASFASRGWLTPSST